MLGAPGSDTGPGHSPGPHLPSCSSAMKTQQLETQLVLPNEKEVDKTAPASLSHLDKTAIFSDAD